MIPISLPFGLFSALAASYSNDTSKIQDLAASSALTTTSIILGILGIGIYLLAFVVIPAYLWKGQSLGKKLLNIKIVKAESHADVEVMDLGKRYGIPVGLNVLGIIPLIGCLASCISVILPVVNLVLLFTDDNKQTLYDKVAETVVVEA